MGPAVRCGGAQRALGHIPSPGRPSGIAKRGSKPGAELRPSRPDGRLIASRDSTGVIRIWDLSTGEALQGIPLQEQVQNAEFIDERHLFVTDSDGRDAYVMTVDVDELLEIARSRVTRELTDEECQTYLHVDACPSD